MLLGDQRWQEQSEAQLLLFNDLFIGRTLLFHFLFIKCLQTSSTKNSPQGKNKESLTCKPVIVWQVYLDKSTWQHKAANWVYVTSESITWISPVRRSKQEFLSSSWRLSFDWRNCNERLQWPNFHCLDFHPFALVQINIPLRYDDAKANALYLLHI